MLERSDIIIADEVVHDPEQVRRVLARQVRRVLAGAEAPEGGVRVVRLAVPIAPVDPLAWLRLQERRPRVFWEGRGDDVQTAAAGAADLCSGDFLDDYDTLRVQLDRVFAHSDNDVRYFGGFRFDRFTPADDVWAPFGTYQFVLPRFELTVRGSEAVLACNLVLPRDRHRPQALLDDVARLPLPSGPLTGELPLPVERRDHPGADGWRDNILWALEAFGREALEKVVFARRVDYEFAEPLDALLLLKRLREATPTTYHFAFEPTPGVSFVGATPERLFLRDGRAVMSEAVAGTRPRGATPREDALLHRELLTSEKDRREHAYVRDSIRDALLALCHPVSVGETSAMTLARGRHLYARVDGHLHDGVLGPDVMQALHPTPAVGGFPTEAALEAIRTREPFDRGWYAGPVGWIGTRGAEFAVAIRSGLVQPHRLSLFSGAGIVEGSDPDSEWREIEQKLGDFMKALAMGE